MRQFAANDLGQTIEFSAWCEVGTPAEPDAIAVAGEARQDVEVQVENFLLACRLVGLHEIEAVGARVRA